MKILFLVSLIFASTAFATGGNIPTMTMSGHLAKPDGTALTSSNVTFQFSVANAGGTCIFYKETFSAIDLSASNGNFELRLGLGSKTYPTGTFTLKDVFKNGVLMNCDSSSTYTPASDEGRVMFIQFMDQNESTPVMRAFTTTVPINSVPYSFYADSAAKLGDNVATDFLTKVGLPTCTVGSFLTWDGTNMSCSNAATAGVTSVGLSMPAIFSVANSPVTTAGTMAVTLANQPVSTVLAAPSGAAGVPTFRSLVAADLPTVGTAGNYGASSLIPVLQIDSYGRVSSASATAVSVSASAITAGTLALANGGTGASVASAARTNLGAAASGSNSDITSLSAANTVGNTTGVMSVIGAGGVSVQAASTGAIALSTNSTTRLLVTSSGNVGIGTASPQVALDVQGTILGKSVSSTGTTMDFISGNILYINNSCAAIQLNNMKDGGNYIFIVKGTSVSTCSFTAYSDGGTTALTVHMPPDHGSTISGKQTIYNFFVAGTDVYVSWVPGY